MKHLFRLIFKNFKYAFNGIYSFIHQKTVRGCSRMKILPYLIILTSFLLGQKLLAAGCCGGGNGGNALLGSEQKSLLSWELSRKEVIVSSVSGKGLWQKPSDPQKVTTQVLAYSMLISDLWQMFVNFPVIQREQNGKRFQNLGDVKVGAAYEFLPDWDYNPLRPRGLIYFGVSAPTGRAPQESREGGLDSTGTGFWDFATGFQLNKSWVSFDASFNLAAHQSLQRKFDSPENSQTVIPGPGGSLSFGGGYTIGNHRIGSQLAQTIESPQKIQTDQSSIESGQEEYATFSLNYSWSASDTDQLAIAYSDQTLFGDPKNTSLSRALSINLVHFWNR